MQSTSSQDPKISAPVSSFNLYYSYPLYTVNATFTCLKTKIVTMIYNVRTMSHKIWDLHHVNARRIFIFLTGTYLGTIFALVFSGFLCDSGIDNGWPLIFYAYGGNVLDYELLLLISFVVCGDVLHFHFRRLRRLLSWIHSRVGDALRHSARCRLWTRSQPIGLDSYTVEFTSIFYFQIQIPVSKRSRVSRT